jgi:hypothetical protein
MQKIMKQFILSIIVIFGGFNMSTSNAQSVARMWNEVLLDAIRVDISRPTVHSRNLCHTTAAMYDAWAAYDEKAGTFFLGNTIGDFMCPFGGIEVPVDPIDRLAAQKMAISYAAYRVLSGRFANSPGAAQSLAAFDDLMNSLGYDINNVSTDYTTNDPAALGNYVALSCLEFGLLDHSNEDIDFDFPNEFYTPVNEALDPSLPGNPNISDLNAWQPLAIDGNPGRRFLSPHWSDVTPFALTNDDLEIYEKNGQDYNIYLDPGAPPHIDMSGATNGTEDYYKWNHALVAVWSGHLDAANPTMIDISPGSIGNLSSLPTTEQEFRAFYNFIDGGVIDTGYAVNPATGLPYQPQVVPLGDFGRVLAEFWADGPSSETPPGHWFTILNAVTDHPDFTPKFEGTGEVLSELEWDVKAYFALGGAMHDVSVAVWGMKSYYDYVRPISAIRAMADLGQSSDSSAMSYHPGGMPLVPNHIELVLAGDALSGAQNEHVGKIKVYAWRGPTYLNGTDTLSAGVDWILAENWWPYQAPSFVTPPFAGYVSGHSTFSRAAAEVLTLLTGDPYFPGGMGVFHAPKDEFLHFEEGPSVAIDLQWATYRDASDQASLSRIWGGIHPPIDDVPGRKLGKVIGPKAFQKAKFYFDGGFSSTSQPGMTTQLNAIVNYPNPVVEQTTFEFIIREQADDAVISIYDLAGRQVDQISIGEVDPGLHQSIWKSHLHSGNYFYQLVAGQQHSEMKKLVVLD